MCQPPGTLTTPPSPPTTDPAAALTCQGQLWGLALSPPTTRDDRLGRKVGTPQLEAGGDTRGRAQVSGAGIPIGGMMGKEHELWGWADMGSDFTA